MRGVGLLTLLVLSNRQDDDAEVQELYTLLHENYVEDGDQMFRFDYSVREPCPPPLCPSSSRDQTTPTHPHPAITGGFSAMGPPTPWLPSRMARRCPCRADWCAAG